MSIRELRRIVFKLLNSSSTDYSPTNTETGHQIGELAVDWRDGSCIFKTSSGKIVPIKGQGYLDLIEYINSSTGVGGTVTDKQNLQIDTTLTSVPSDALKGVLKIRVTNPDGTKSMRAVTLITDASGVMIKLPDGSGDISLSDFYTTVTAFMKDTDAKLSDYLKRLEDIEKESALSTIDKNLYYDQFTKADALNLAYEISVGNNSDGTIKRNLLEVVTTLGMDSGLSINRHQILVTIDGIAKTITAKVNSIGSAVDLSVEFYSKNNKIYVRPTHIDGEFILKDKCINVGSHKPFAGSVAKAAFNSLGLGTSDLLEVTGGGSGGSGASTYKVTQVAHGFGPFTAVTYVNGLWKKATLDEHTKALAIREDADVITVITGGHTQVPAGALDDEGDAFRDGEYYFLSQTVHGGITKKKPTLVYQDLGYCYTKNGVPFFSVDIETPVDLESEAIQDFVTKGELATRQLVVQHENEIGGLTLPTGTFITVATGVNGHYRQVEDVSKAGSIVTINGKYANIVDTNKYIEELKLLINGKLDSDPNINPLYNTAVKIITKMLDIDSKKLDKGTYTGNADNLIDLIELRLLKSKACNDFTSGGTDTYATGELIKQLYLIVQTIKDGGSLRSVLLVEKLSGIRSSSTLLKGATVITSTKGFLMTPTLFIEGQFQHPSSYTLNKTAGTITLKEAYSLKKDVPYELLDEYQSDIKFSASTALYVTGSNVKNDLVLGDVVKILGESNPNDGGHHLRVVENTKKLNGLSIGTNLWFNEVPYSNLKTIALENEENRAYLSGNSIGRNGITTIQESGTKYEGALYKNTTTKKLCVCIKTTTDVSSTSVNFVDLSNISLNIRLTRLEALAKTNGWI